MRIQTYCGVCVFFNGKGKCKYVRELRILKNGHKQLIFANPLKENRHLSCQYFISKKMGVETDD